MPFWAPDIPQKGSPPIWLPRKKFFSSLFLIHLCWSIELIICCTVNYEKINYLKKNYKYFFGVIKNHKKTIHPFVVLNTIKNFIFFVIFNLNKNRFLAFQSDLKNLLFFCSFQFKKKLKIHIFSILFHLITTH